MALALVLVPVPGATAAEGPEDSAGLKARAAYFAAQLRKFPVYVTDQTPRVMPRSAWPAFLEQAQRTGVPTYVLVLPFPATYDSDELVTAVREELGRKGLYVVLNAQGGGYSDASAEAYGVGGLPVEESLDSADAWLPSDATALDYFTAFVDGLRNDGDASGSGAAPSSYYTTADDRTSQSVTTGVLTGLLPALVLAVGVPIALRRGSRRRLLVPAVIAAVCAVAVPLSAQAMMPERSSTGDPDPTGRDMELRAERFAAGLRKGAVHGDAGLRRGAVYQDAELPPVLTSAELRSLQRHLAGLGMPVYLTVVPLDFADESEGEAELFADRVHRALGKDGLYVTAGVDTYDNVYLDVSNYGMKLDEFELHEYSDWVTYGPEDIDVDPQLHRRVVKLTQHLAKVPAGPPGKPYVSYEHLEDPVAEDALPPLLTDEDGPLGISGPFLAGLAGGGGVPAAIAGTVWVVRRVRGETRPEPAKSAKPSKSAKPARPVRRSSGREQSGAWAERHPGSPDSRPSLDWLRSTAGRELAALRRKFAATRPRGDAYALAQDCLEAAGLLLDADGDQHLNRDVTAVDLASGLALIRAGRAALDSASVPAQGGAQGDGPGGAGFAPDTRLCTLNPLHGPASMTARLSATPGARARLHPVCGECGAALSKVASGQRSGAVDRLRLGLPAAHDPADRPGRTPYVSLPGPLGEAGASGNVEVRGLVLGIREAVGSRS
ncbi:hypothetical protein [Streptomyces sp. Da 82-17]|uniref:hypothetical protein n=1 Tax=Streptomyces sp. Da 82-17 TaxID=3377116 RepID=UPI0038D3D13C